VESARFSVEDLVAERGLGYIHYTISFIWDEFQELYTLVAEAMTQSGSGRRSQRSPMNRSFRLMPYLTSGLTARPITAALQFRKGTMPRIPATCLRPVVCRLESFFPDSIGDVV
jgi:hypothetical protein